MPIISLHRKELEPCYSCPHGCRIPHYIAGEFVGESVTCQCPEKDSAGRCQCDDAKRIIEKIGGA